MVKIFFGCSMRGGFGKVTQDDLRSMVDVIEELGYTLMSRHQTSATFDEDEAPLTNQQIHDRDYKWLLGADMAVFEISNPSLGAGGEISDMSHLGKPILCIYQKELEGKVSAYILGKKGSEFIKSKFEIASYENVSEAKEIIRKFVEKNKKA